MTTADMSAARKDAEELIEDYGGHIGAVIADLLTALDQAAEALKPWARLADAFSDESWAEDDEVSVSCADWVVDNTSLSVFDVRRAATVYATLKPEGETQ